MQKSVEPVFEPSEDIVPTLILISKSMRALHGIKLASLGFHNGQDELLLVLDETGMTTSALADELCVRPSTVSKMMDRLTEKGLVCREDDPRDKRRTIVRITPAGKEVCKQLAAARRELEDDLRRSLPVDVRSSIVASLTKCQIHLTKKLSRLR
ncbi:MULTISPECIES: MarR family winged helix-turn-helix transcriptional regulator [unclassified Aureimonas]|uniref:MarR family winged helix-turn-helix transcriptional regulator n=1 Tax=unclassified Aureimonas TaxID=2615206 RepID=UPI0006F8E631|nr:MULTISPECIES: MarR family transcriptional regulator [unclassified Aureimonas]KQT52477.1 hypothetical protein ASG62_14750 [Aureimonas sp. Leaf427]KQT77622.1 hypothetical protein ASG54_11660 [Aureimonas sp. Leaf460]